MLMAGVSHGSKGSTSACEGVADGQQDMIMAASQQAQHHAMHSHNSGLVAVSYMHSSSIVVPVLVPVPGTN